LAIKALPDLKYFVVVLNPRFALIDQQSLVVQSRPIQLIVVVAVVVLGIAI
jgi:hypothetical protein